LRVETSEFAASLPWRWPEVRYATVLLFAAVTGSGASAARTRSTRLSHLRTLQKVRLGWQRARRVKLREDGKKTDGQVSSQNSIPLFFSFSTIRACNLFYRSRSTTAPTNFHFNGCAVYRKLKRHFQSQKPQLQLQVAFSTVPNSRSTNPGWKYNAVPKPGPWQKQQEPVCQRDLVVGEPCPRWTKTEWFSRKQCIQFAVATPRMEWEMIREPK